MPYLACPDPRYVVQWQAPNMAAPAFWYYRSLSRAARDADYLRSCGYVVDCRWYRPGEGN